MEVVKVCRECGEEYRPEILRCADCGGDLEVRYEAERASWPPPQEAGPPPDPRPPGEYEPIAWSALAAELTPLADRLVEAGIPFYLRPRPSDAGAGSAGYEIRVRQEERDVALREMADLKPEQAEAAAPSHGAQSCPACGHALAAGAAECPDCGLTLGESAE
jgi:hypothetical protein